MHSLKLETTDIPGLLILGQHVQHNDVGWFKEDWHREKMGALGLPDFRPVQQNFTHNDRRGITRGFLAEPWDRLITVVSGRAMGAWVDLRIGDSFGKVVTHDLNQSSAVFVPRGIANAHQILEDNTTFSYLLNHHWTPEARSRFSTVNLFDPALGIAWPIPRDEAELSRSEAQQPLLADATPMQHRRALVVGSDSRLGRALLAELPGAVGISAAEMDRASRSDSPVDLSAYDTLINAQGETGTGSPRTPGPARTWGEAVAQSRYLTDIARRHRMRYVHVSADGVFERNAPTHAEDEPLSLADAHSKTLVMGEVLATTVPRHLVIRTGWVVGRDDSWVDEMAAAARRGNTPEVIPGHHGRLTFANTVVAGIVHLLDSDAASGTYNLTGDGPLVSWAQVAGRIFELCDRRPEDVQKQASGSEEMAASHGNALDLTKLKATGFRPGNSWLQLEDHLPGSEAPRAPARPESRLRPAVAQGSKTPSLGSSAAPYRVLFVCTANICRSAYADVVARAARIPGVEFNSAGTHALVGQGIDPPMAERVGSRGDVPAHVAQQLTRQLLMDADVVLAMGVGHRRYILDEWPALGRKVFLIGHVAREMARLPEAMTRQGLVSYLWKHRSADPADAVADPYGRGPAAAVRCATTIDAHLDEILGGCRRLNEERTKA